MSILRDETICNRRRESGSSQGCRSTPTWIVLEIFVAASSRRRAQCDLLSTPPFMIVAGPMRNRPKQCSTMSRIYRMDFIAWFEVFLGGKWHTFDARHTQRRIGRILMAVGRDAADVALTTNFGSAKLLKFHVITEEVK